MIDETNNIPAGVPPSGEPVAANAAHAGYQQVPGTYDPATGYSVPPIPPPPGARSAFDGGNPSPVLAAILGFIPGVGAVYNGQIAKGIAHVIIFVLLDSLKHASDIFHLFVALWVFYQVFDAYQTAIARRDGLVLPDPLHLNNVGETFFHATRQAQSAQTPPPVAAWGTPPVAAAQPFDAPVAQTAYTQSATYAAATPPYVPPYPQPDPVAYAPVSTGVPAWSAMPAPPLAPRNRFPTAAVWLIGLGALFMIVNLFPELHLNVNHVGPIVLIGAGIGLLLSRLSKTGGIGPMADEGESYGARVIHNLRAPAVVTTVGALLLIENTTALHMARSWPILVIVIGVVMLLERSVQDRLLLPVPPPPPVISNDPYQPKEL